VSGDSAAGGPEGEGVAEDVGGGVAGKVSNGTVIRKVRSSEWVEDTTGSTLAARDYKDSGDVVVQSQAFRKAAQAQSVEDDESWVADGQANTLNTFDMGDTRTTHAIVEPYCLQGSLEGRSDTAGPQGAGWKHGETFTLNTADRHAVADTQYGVRRLTPVECERLQAFPDGWTEPAGSDSARYKALGNAVTVNTVRWVLGRMLEQP
jgi:DNA (cytosine-5)-methyltransferase 1